MGGHHDKALEISRELMSNVIRRWPSFAEYFSKTLENIRAHFKEVGESSAAPGGQGQGTEDSGYDFPPYVLSIYEESGWSDMKNVSSGARARLLALKLEECGFCCEFTDTE